MSERLSPSVENWVRHMFESIRRSDAHGALVAVRQIISELTNETINEHRNKIADTTAALTALREKTDRAFQIPLPKNRA